MNPRKSLTTIALVFSLVTGGVLLAGCEDEPKKPGAQQSGQQQTEQAFRQQSAAVPYPVDQLKDSLERRNIRERLLRTNNSNKVGYLYLQGWDGKPYGYYVIKGKVSSTQSQMTTDQLISRDLCGSSCTEHVVTNAPGDDGSYGANEDGIFFFTVEGAFVETDSKWLWSDQPLPLSVPKFNSAK